MLRDAHVLVKAKNPSTNLVAFSPLRYFLAVLMIRNPELRPMTSWMMSIRGALADNIPEEQCALLGSSVSPEGLDNILQEVVDGLGHADDDNLVAMLFEDGLRKFSRLGVGILAANGVDDL
jgi:hypothetical protein